MPRIFINPRGEDASGHAGRLYDALAGRFGREQVFMDVDAIRPGENFATVLDDSVTSCDVDRLLRHLDADAPQDIAAPGSARAPRATRGRRAPVVMALAALAALAAVLVPGRSSRPRHSAAVPPPVKDPTPKPSPPGLRFASYATNGFRAQLPKGGGWSAPATSEPNPGRLFRTTVRGPGGAFVLVDATPRDKPVFVGTFMSRRHVGQTAFASAVRYVFRDGGTFPECRRSRCIDDQISVPGSPGGLTVPAGGPHFALTRRLASTVTASLTPADS